MTDLLLWYLQILVGAAGAWGSFVLMVTGVDRHTRLARSLGVLAVFIASCVYVITAAAEGRATVGTVELVFACAVAWAVNRHGRKVRGVFAGDWDQTQQMQRSGRRR